MGAVGFAPFFCKIKKVIIRKLLSDFCFCLICFIFAEIKYKANVTVYTRYYNEV